jgi:hypothetical protein
LTIRALDTKYAGCLFRSRLESRWAVYFDHMHLEWEYEPQGFELDKPITRGEGTIRYLPDFWLPGHDAWGEVKGSLTRDELLRLLDAAASLSSPSGGCGGGHDLIVFGPVTSSALVGTPIRLHLHKGDLLASCWACETHSGVTVATDDGSVDPDLERLLLRGYGCARHNLDSTHLDALDAARTARFEHGAKPKAARK